MVGDPSESFVALNAKMDADHVTAIVDQSIIESLVAPLDVIMLRALPHHVAQVFPSQRDALGQTPGLDRADESLRIGIQIQTSSGHFPGLDAEGSRDFTKRCRAERITVMIEVARWVSRLLLKTRRA
jgi:hypothetical protein